MINDLTATCALNLHEYYYSSSSETDYKSIWWKRSSTVMVLAALGGVKVVSSARPFTDSCSPGRKGLVTHAHTWCSWNALISVWDFCLKPDVGTITLRV